MGRMLEGIPSDLFPDLTPQVIRLPAPQPRHQTAMAQTFEPETAVEAEVLPPSVESVQMAIHRRHLQLTEMAIAIKAHLNAHVAQPVHVHEGPNIWRIPGAQALFGFSALVFIAAVMLSVLSYRNMRASEEVAALMAKVNEVGAFETRIAEKLERSNVGVQTLINETNNRISFLQGQVSSLPTDTRAIVSELDAIAKNLIAIPAQLATAPSLEPQFEAGEPAPAAPRAAPRPKRINVAEALTAANAAAPMPKASKSFRRIVAEDGTVRFEKIR